MPGLVPQDVQGLAAAMGGRDTAAARLDGFFHKPDGSWSIRGGDPLRYDPTNEPGIHAPWLYNALGQPWKTQETVRELVDTVYGTGPSGQLSTAEREHLARLAGQVPPGTDADRQPVPDEAHRLLDRLVPTPAYLVDERQAIAAWNAAMAALIPGFEQTHAAERNTVRLAIRLGGTFCRAAQGRTPHPTGDRPVNREGPAREAPHLVATDQAMSGRGTARYPTSATRD